MSIIPQCLWVGSKCDLNGPGVTQAVIKMSARAESSLHSGEGWVHVQAHSVAIERIRFLVSSYAESLSSLAEAPPSPLPRGSCHRAAGDLAAQLIGVSHPRKAWPKSPSLIT